MGMTIAPERVRESDVDEDVDRDRPWVTIVWNDPINHKCLPPHTTRRGGQLAFT